MMSVYPLLLLLLFIYAFGGSRAFGSMEHLINRTSNKSNQDFRSESESRRFSQWKGMRSLDEITSATKGKRQQLGKLTEERPEDLARDINEALKDSEEGGDESPFQSQWVISNPEDRYQNTYREGPDGQEVYDVRDPSPATFVYREYPEATNETADDFMETDRMEDVRAQNGYGQSEDILMPITNEKLQNYDDLDLGENIPDSVAKGVKTTRYEDITADGALPLSANQIKGSFKINQGVVTGEGKYEINPEEVDVKVKLHIQTRSKVGPANGGLEGGYGFRRGHFGNKKNLDQYVSA